MVKNMLFLVLTIITLDVFGQVWIDSGAVWHYNFSNVGLSCFSKYQYVEDTIIQNKNCQKIVGSYYEFGYDQYHILRQLGHGNLKSQYTYISGDTVFLWNDFENRFFTLFNFGAQVGDSWITTTQPNPNYQVDPNTDNDSSRIIVTATGNIQINSHNYRYIKIEPTYGSPYGMKGTYVERFGNIDSFPDAFHTLFPGTYDYTNSLTVEWNQYSFKCFEDKSFSLYNPSNQDCEYYLSIVGTKELQKNKYVKYYPNPSNGEFTIESTSNEQLSVTIYDSFGRLLRSLEVAPMESLKVDISENNSGIYFLRIQDVNDNITTLKIIKDAR